ncbi:lactoylglutathione lyase [Aspergillus oryzae]|uniref:Lactoylglutathione lyase n=5 Tax=Aspergillus oryzae TaxID=5062 RepID=A0A1S9DNS0_ASPOZ|nr:lactoylglutathione lyase [Aspergillus oryzae]
MATDTSTYKLNHTMIRVKDPKKSLEFYKFLGLTQIQQLDFPENKFSLYFLAYNGPKSLQGDRHWTDRNAVLELTHNYGTENDPNYSVANGNTEPHRGFGHIAISVDNIESACKRIEDAGYPFQKKLTDGRMKHIAFAKDPDGYWVELIRRHNEDVGTTTDTANYRLNHSMLRVKCAETSLKFYQEVMGMTLLRTAENKDAGFNLYFLGYPAGNPKVQEDAKNPVAEWEGLLELTWNYGTEKQEGPVYHNGNAEPQGFGHICVAVDDLNAACERFESLNVNWKKRLTDGRMKDVAFVLDPDGYWIEVIQNQALKRTSNWVSLRAATELFSARIDQLCQFIYDHGLEPPPMRPEDEAGVNRVLDTLQIPRGLAKKRETSAANEIISLPQKAVAHSPAHSSPSAVPDANERPPEIPTPPQNALSNQKLVPSAEKGRETINSFGVNSIPTSHYVPANWGFTLPTAESLDTIYANLNDGTSLSQENSLSPESLQLTPDMQQQPGELLRQARYDRECESDSGDEDEAEKDVIEQISNRIGTLKIAGDGHLRFYGATSNLNLVDVSATQQRQRPDARTVRHDGQDILNHLRVGQPVDQALEDHLVELYFTWQNTSTYVVDKDMYMIARSKWRNEYDDTPFYSEVLTNAMCAIGSAFEARYHPTFITFPKSLSEFFADRAKALLEIELDSPCVATVQALVILSCHEGSANRDARGWLYSGMSTRLAFDLGLHIDMTPYVEKGEIGAFEADVRRIAFWGSYTADHFWGFYLGRPFRMNAGDITVPKLASDLGAEKESTWYPYGLPTKSDILKHGLRNPNELISRQFAVLWEIISPVGHILYGCSDIPRHDLQRLCHRVTDDLFAWKANLPSILDINLENDTIPQLPQLLMLHMQYHQIVIFTHRPWVSKSYIQPRAPRQGPGYHHARRMCIESSTAIARLLHIYEKFYTFRRMNNQVVAIIFSAALMLLYVTISNTSTSGRNPSDNPNNNAEMVAYLNLCFRALDELGQSFENAKRTRDFLVSLQRRWQAHMRRSGSALKRQISNRPSSQHLVGLSSDADASRKKTRITAPRNQINYPVSATAASQATTAVPNQPQSQPQPSGQHPLDATQHIGVPGEFDWIRNSDLQLLSGNFGDSSFSQFGNVNTFGEDPALPSLSDIEPWWDTPNGNTFGGSSL